MANAAGSANFWVHVETEIARAILQVFPQVIKAFTDNLTPWNIWSKIRIIVHIYIHLIMYLVSGSMTNQWIRCKNNKYHGTPNLRIKQGSIFSVHFIGWFDLDPSMHCYCMAPFFTLVHANIAGMSRLYLQAFAFFVNCILF